LYFEWADALAIVSFFAIGALVYGVFIPSLGFYWDDWPVVWVYNALGPAGLTRYFAGERPVAGWIYAHLAPILGIYPIGWHVVSLAVRCASSATLFVAFCRLWPRQRDIAWLVGTIVLLYPGFTQQPIGLNYLETHLPFFLFVVSLATTIFSITTPAYRWLFLAVSLVTGALSYLITEYFIGLEFFRLLVIVVLTRPEGVMWDLKRLKAALLTWSPYAAIWTAYVVWRAFVFRFAPTIGYKDPQKDVHLAISSVLSNPIHEIFARVFVSIHNILMSAVIGWARPFNPELVTLDRRSLHSWIIASIVAAIAIFTLRRLGVSRQRESGPLGDEPGHSTESGLLLGVLGLAVAGLPLAIPAIRVDFTGQPSFADRFTLSFMLPASLTLSCLLAFLGTKRLPRVSLVALIIFAFSAYQIQNESLYRQDWRAQKSIFWQLAWRAPALKQGTSIFVDDMPRSVYGNHSAGLLNMLYNRDDSAGRLDYFIFDLSQFSSDRFSWGGANLTYKPGNPIIGGLRSFEFYGTTSQSLVSWISPTGTFRIVAQPYATEILQCSALCFNISNVSEPAAVISDGPGLPGGPLLKIFGSEPKHEWWYFYQKAELERQLKDWGTVATLGDEVIKQGYKPSDPSEWFPFIEGYARTHRYRTAVDISNSVLEESPDALAPLSSLWLRVKRENSQNSAELNSALRVLEDKLMLQDRQ
jgi:hypothetical protein